MIVLSNDDVDNDDDDYDNNDNEQQRSIKYINKTAIRHTNNTISTTHLYCTTTTNHHYSP